MTNYYCTTYIDYDQAYHSNFVHFTTINKVEYASLTISGGGDVLTVTEGKQYDGFTCSTGDASPEPEISLKLNDPSSTVLPVRKLKSRTRIERRPTFCSHLANDETNTFITSISVTYVPEREHDGKYVYCSARNSEMGISDKVTSNKIRLIVQYAYTVDESESLTVKCSADCKPSCTYTWSYLDRGIATGSRLHLTHITRQEAGYYKCMARNPRSGITADKHFKLHVESKYTLFKSYFSVGVAVGVGVAIGLGMSVVAVVIYCVARK
ncbi:putative pregnancy-specific beta-1-glycoprotein 7 [Gigantopelta aegis]|uniref:putative pregnancy-specific beta-1-glycoprotein 7 n=1 Tax=Gigantopelta aegis TaxID=1735272 RepID=UPI001B88B828|nr:putative pregnancy-specific beta-1-glycoprotein 7 [Gigantopelta aegis]